MVFEKNTTPEVVKVLCSNQARTFSIRKKNNMFKKKCRLAVCLLMFGRFSCLVTVFCWAFSNFYLTERVLICYCNL